MSNIFAARSAFLCKTVARSHSSLIVRRSFQEAAAKYFQKHSARKSPLSPSLAVLIRRIPLTSFLSITHRITGMGVGILLYGIGITELCQSKLSFEQILAKLKNIVPDFLYQFFKVATGTAIFYHTVNGVRHLSWDAGYGFKLQHLYRSGYLVLALTAIATLYIISKNNN